MYVFFFTTVSAFNLKVTQNCTKKSDVVCTCETGFICVEMVPLSENCRYCEKEQKTSKAGKYRLIHTEFCQIRQASTKRLEGGFMINNKNLTDCERMNNNDTAYAACL